MTTAIVGVGNIGSAVARHLTAGGESVVLTAKDLSRAQALAEDLGPLARAACIRTDDADTARRRILGLGRGRIASRGSALREGFRDPRH